MDLYLHALAGFVLFRASKNAMNVNLNSSQLLMEDVSDSWLVLQSALNRHAPETSTITINMSMGRGVWEPTADRNMYTVSESQNLASSFTDDEVALSLKGVLLPLDD